MGYAPRAAEINAEPTAETAMVYKILPDDVAMLPRPGGALVMGRDSID